MRSLGLSSHRDYLRFLLEDESGEEIIQLLDVISTNVTSFFREAEHFEYLENFLKEIVESGQKKIRIWCAASSTGEEPFTIAMVSYMATAGKQIDLKIVDATVDLIGKTRQEELQAVLEYMKVPNLGDHLEVYNQHAIN